MTSTNSTGPKPQSGVLDSSFKKNYCTVLQSALTRKTTVAPEFEVPCKSGGVYVGFQPVSEQYATELEEDIIGYSYVFLADITHHRETMGGNKYCHTELMNEETGFLAQLSTELVALLNRECGLSPESTHFIRYEDEDLGGGVFYAVPITTPSSY